MFKNPYYIHKKIIFEKLVLKKFGYSYYLYYCYYLNLNFNLKETFLYRYNCLWEKILFIIINFIISYFIYLN
jgi:hypothetical protein